MNYICIGSEDLTIALVLEIALISHMLYVHDCIPLNKYNNTTRALPKKGRPVAKRKAKNALKVSFQNKPKSVAILIEGNAYVEIFIVFKD